MPRYRYSFIRSDGVTAHATADVENELILAARLQRDHCHLLRAAPERSWQTLTSPLHLTFSRSSIILALHELGSLIRAGLPIDRGLGVVAELTPELRLRETLQRVRDQVRRGKSLADSMEAEPAYFKALHVNLVRAGEASGALDEALLRLAAHLQNQDALRAKVQVALIYPVILLLVGVAALVLLATVVLPQLAPIFADAGQQMPEPTRLVLDASSILRRFGWLLVILMVGMVLLIRETLKQAGPRTRWDRYKLRIPLVGQIISSVQTARFARTAGTLLRAGVPLPTALTLARQTLTNFAMDGALREATVAVRGGRSLTEALRGTNLFPGLSVQLIAVGEESGHLDEMLVHQAELFERSAARRLESLVAILVPALTMTIGASVAGVLASILLAVMKLNELAS